MTWRKIESGKDRRVTARSARAGDELVVPSSLDLIDLRDQRLLCTSTIRHRVGEPPDPPAVIAASKEDQTRGVSRDVGRDRHAHRWWDEQGQLTGQQPRDEHAAHSPVAVGEGVGDLELCVADCRVGDGIDVDAIDLDHQVIEQTAEGSRRRRREMRVKWTGSANLTLLIPGDPDVALRRGAARHQRSMPRAQRLDIERRICGRAHHGACDRGQVRRHPRGRFESARTEL